MTQTCYTYAPTGTNGAAFNDGQFVGNKFSTGNALIGQAITQITVWMYNDQSSNSSLIYAEILDSSNSVIATSTNGINNNTLNTGPAFPSQFTECVYTFASHTLANGEKFVVRNGTGHKLHCAQLYEFSSEPNPVYCSTSDCPLSTHQIRMCLSTGSTPSSGGTLLPPPIAMVRL